jgi:hypothetical protein
MSNQGDLGFASEKKNTGPVECLGQTFESDEARREHYLALLAEKLKDPEFRKTPGFPKGTDEAILRMSDPPYYTACPNPFLEEFVRVNGRPYDPDEKYDREPFAVDVSVGKTDQLYRAHAYHTKVPHLAIAPSILHYTKPGDLILDGFCGSGMTGVAAQWCGTAPLEYRRDLEAEWRKTGHVAPKWGGRSVVLNDLGPIASFIAAGYNTPFDTLQFEMEARRLLRALSDEIGWMYETKHPADGRTGKINFTVWSEVFSCPECVGDVNFLHEALDPTTKKTATEFPCPHCGAGLTRRRLERLSDTKFDTALNETVALPRREAVLINYTVGTQTYEKQPDAADLHTIDKICSMPLPEALPTVRMMHSSGDCKRWGDEWRAGVAAFTHMHHLFVPRAANAMAALWQKAGDAPPDIRLHLLWMVEQAIWTMTTLNRYRPTGYSQVNQFMSGRIRMLSQHAECSPWYILHAQHKRNTKVERLVKAFAQPLSKLGTALITTGDCATTRVPNDAVDYIFTDPPFGANFAYAELNFIIESWHRVATATCREAIESPHQGKSTLDYQDLMRSCFEEYHRVLKPGRWMTVVFSNNSNAVWRAIQEALGTAGFVVADVRTMDKEQLSFNQVAGVTVKKDLMISAYKPTDQLAEQFKLGSTTESAVWAFVDEHLRNVPVFVGSAGAGDVIAERTPQVLLDRMIGFFVQRGVAVPISRPEFLAGLKQRYPEPRDGMFFRHGDQVAEYDRKRTTVQEMKQLTWLVSDEASATGWLRQQLHAKPQSDRDIQPLFMQHSQSWAKHEVVVDLKEILSLNFLRYDGTGPVPSQIHSYLSNGYREYRNLENDDPRLQAKAKDRWYVPNPNKEGDLEKLRLKTLLKEFEEYRTSTLRKIKQFRTEAVRAGFKHCYDQSDYATIVAVAAKLPEKVIQEDEKLLMYYDVATMRLDD